MWLLHFTYTHTNLLFLLPEVRNNDAYISAWCLLFFIKYLTFHKVFVLRHRLGCVNIYVCVCVSVNEGEMYFDGSGKFIVNKNMILKFAIFCLAKSLSINH